ncbi:hypothetical protein HPB50_004834 [Hyalomma asiaticum]|uniref:Uncharacterized protein n=1 Tax=Hyalomma asiaticum TaxID=266040 RepID=A0ACB7SKV4_HYAAI|nr:hypothetical protein HPB50_004834 [Hyalomma asiaticum]
MTTDNQPNKYLSRATHLINRITNRKQGVKQQDTLRIIQALDTSRAAYGTPCLGVTNSGEDKMNTLTRKARSITLCHPQTTSTEKLLTLGMRNTWEELHEAQKSSQIKRLNHTRTGRDTLRRMGYRATKEQDWRLKASPELRGRISVSTIPLNI